MSQAPTPYDRQANFVTDASNNPLSGPSPTKLDKEFDAVEKALDTTQSRLAEIQRDDGALRNGIVTNDSLDPAIVFPGSRISQNSITSYHLADGSVGTTEIIDNSVTTDKIPDGAITSAKIADGAVAISDIADLATTLAGKQPVGNYVTTSDSRLSDSRTPTLHKSTHATGGSDALSPGDIGAAQAVHNHAILDVTGLQTALNNKAAVGHTHTISEVSGLQTALDGKQIAGNYAAESHTHAIADVTGLQSTLTSLTTSVNSKLNDAPSDGTQYARKDGAWQPVSGGGGGIPAAHAASHATGGSDPITPLSIGAAAFGNADADPSLIWVEVTNNPNGPNTIFKPTGDSQPYTYTANIYGGYYSIAPDPISGLWRYYFYYFDTDGNSLQDLIAEGGYISSDPFPYYSGWNYPGTATPFLWTISPLSSLAGSPLGLTALEGVSPFASRADHVHPLPTPAQIGAQPAGNYQPAGSYVSPSTAIAFSIAL